MANMPAFVTQIQGIVSAAEWFATQKFTRQTIYKQYLTQVKDPVYPCITIAYLLDKREVFADIDTGTLILGIHAKEYGTPEQVSKLLNDTLHLKTFATDDVILYMCHAKGGPPQPLFNSQLNCWEVLNEFEIKVG